MIFTKEVFSLQINTKELFTHRERNNTMIYKIVLQNDFYKRAANITEKVRSLKKSISNQWLRMENKAATFVTPFQGKGAPQILSDSPLPSIPDNVHIHQICVLILQYFVLKSQSLSLIVQGCFRLPQPALSVGKEKLSA